MQTHPAPTPRLASTLLVLRGDFSHHEVLMGRRSSMHRFMPNSLVFPGGAVDPDDYAAPVGSTLKHDVAARLLRSQDDGTARALAVAAARELAEETGLTLGEPPALQGLDLLCRAITPSERPKRFDAYFFVTWQEFVVGDVTSSHELEDVRYVPLQDAMAAELEFATRGALEKLAEWLGRDPAERDRSLAVPVMRERVWHRE